MHPVSKIILVPSSTSSWTPLAPLRHHSLLEEIVCHRGRRLHCRQSRHHLQQHRPHEPLNLLAAPCPSSWLVAFFFRFFLSDNSASSSISSSSTSSSAIFALAAEPLLFPAFLPFPPPLRYGRKNRRAVEPFPFDLPGLSFSSLGLATLSE